MISLNNLNAPAISDDFGRLTALAAFFSDSKACAARMAEIQQATDAANELIAKASEIEAAHQKQREAIKAERAAHEKQIAADRARFDGECASRAAQIKDSETAIARLQAATKAEREEAARLTADLRLRVERVRSAAA
ncbi:chromosome segregation ATPase [Bradyrhizobium sp. AZCC 2262]|uniref:hypothetical protein n=1 Tax=Bradyrhizobium sp. AZCC 2262 TaxID=3117022 RepID=UPI002FF0E3C6